MNRKEANKLIEEIATDIEVDKLSDKAKKLFEAIMTIADERDELKKEVNKNAR